MHDLTLLITGQITALILTAKLELAILVEA